MKKSILGLIVLFVLFTTYLPKFDANNLTKVNIEKIIVENNSIIESNNIINRLNFLYDENLFLVNSTKIKDALNKIDFIESFRVKKIYPKIIKIIIQEKVPIAILHYKKDKFYITERGDLIKFKKLVNYSNLPKVFGNGKNFISFYQNIQKINFPMKEIESFYFFESGRWDLKLHNNKIIKLPVNDYLFSLKNYNDSKDKTNFKVYKTFDYRIKDQLILN